MIWRSDRARRCDWFNTRWQEFAGEDLLAAMRDDWVLGVHPDERRATAEAYENAVATNARLSLTVRMLRNDGAWRTVIYNGAPFSRNGAFAGYFGSCTDVSEQQEMYERLEQAYRERDGLLREIYHRVKNNLQQIQGLIAIEAVALNDDHAKAALLALNGRVQSMGVVHQMLLASKDLTHISAREFITSLCSTIGSANAASRRGIEIVADADDVDVDIERAVVKGLIVNELVTNSLRHAFPAGRPGKIVVSFRRPDSTDSILEVLDNGVGVVGSGERQTGAPQVGMHLVRGLAAQLDGKLSQETPASGGSLFRIVIPRH